MAFPGDVAQPFPGFGFGKGIGGGLNLDVGGGLGAGLPGLIGGALPGWGGPYIPVTPLGALGGIKGDLIVPIVAVGVALFLLVLIVMAVKYALAWKLSVLDDLSGPKKWKREQPKDAPAPQLQSDYLDQLARIVVSAIYSGTCADRMLCEVGSFARGNAEQLKSIISLVESYVPPPYANYLEIVKASAEGNFDCSQKYQCGKQQQPQQPQPQGEPGNGVPKTRSATNSSNAQHESEKSNVQAQTPRPDLKTVLFNATANQVKPKAGKFRRYSDK